MDFEQWQTTKAPAAMLHFAQNKVTDRRFRLLACALARQYWDQLSVDGKNAITLAERYLEDPTAYDEMVAAGTAISVSIVLAGQGAPVDFTHPDGVARAAAYPNGKHAIWVIQSVRSIPGLKQAESVAFVCTLIREVIGNPFVAPLDPALLSWKDATLPKLANKIYQNQAFDQLPILADALEEAGCHEPTILEHCRDPHSQHVRGCWIVEMILDPTTAELSSSLVLPQEAWFVTCYAKTNKLRRNDPDQFPLGEEAEPHLIPVLAEPDPKFLIDPSYEDQKLRSSSLVRSFKQVWYVNSEDKFSLKAAKATVEEGVNGKIYLWTSHGKAIAEMAEGYAPIKHLINLRTGITKPLAEAVLQGDQRALFDLVRLLEKINDERAGPLRDLIPGMVPLEELNSFSSESATSEEGPDTELEDLQETAKPCPSCGKSRRAFRVKKEGPNHGRMFLKCSDRECGNFEWASEASAAPGKDTELTHLQENATPCPACGKERKAFRVKKNGPNKGRLFLRCSDHDCNSFEWALSDSDGNAKSNPYGAVLSTLRNQFGTCHICEQTAHVGRSTKPGPNHGRYFVRCDCGYFSWMSDDEGDFYWPDFE